MTRSTLFETRKGNVAHAKIEDEYALLIDALQQSDERPGVRLTRERDPAGECLVRSSMTAHRSDWRT